MFKKTMILFFSCFSFGHTESLFNYDLHLTSLPGTNGRTMICFHGYGDNYQIAESLKNLNCIDSTLVSFNFPEHDIKQGKKYDYKTATFGTIDELLPAFYVLKQIVIDQKFDSIDLYGFSAGGGAVVNLIKTLNTSTYDTQLKKIGIHALEKTKLLTAIQKGILVLDTPLKSIDEIIAFRGSTEELEILAKNYRDNQFIPIESLKSLKGLSLNILLHFQEKDEVLSGRDDQIFISQLEDLKPNSIVKVVIGNDGGHLTPHMSLWRELKAFYP